MSIPTKTKKNIKPDDDLSESEGTDTDLNSDTDDIMKLDDLSDVALNDEDAIYETEINDNADIKETDADVEEIDDIDDTENLDKESTVADDADADDSVFDDTDVESNIIKINNKASGEIDILGCIIEDNDDTVDMDIPKTMVSMEKRMSFPKLTLYEKVRIIAVRTKQLAMGAPPYVKNVSMKSPEEIALIELEYNMIPYKISRPMPNNTYEIWKISELEK